MGLPLLEYGYVVLMQSCSEACLALFEAYLWYKKPRSLESCATLLICACMTAGPETTLFQGGEVGMRTYFVCCPRHLKRQNMWISVEF